ncbi:MAG TPA: hypothetical protein VMC09_16595 [Anaerolineales bacterium]|nr:hypothetical protein [Anaerolineales bacterium]
MRKSVLFSVVAFLLIWTSACSSQVAPPANALFFDDFKQASSNWPRIQNDAGISDFANGYYHIFVKDPGTLILAKLDKVFQADVSIEVDARKLGGTDDNYYGILCHYQDPDNYYMLLITSDGYSGIAMRQGGLDSMISPALKFLKMNGIKTGRGVNHIRADCVGDKMALFVNGKQVSLAYSKSITGGSTGLVVRSGMYLGDTDVRFDNFTVLPPLAEP